MAIQLIKLDCQSQGVVGCFVLSEHLQLSALVIAFSTLLFVVELQQQQQGQLQKPKIPLPASPP